MKWLISVAVAVAMLLGGVAMASPALALELPDPTVPPEPEITVPAVPADFELPGVTLPDQCAQDNAPVFQDDSVIHDPVVDDPVVDDPVIDEPDGPVVHDPVVDQPDAPVVDAPVVAEPAADAAVSNDAVAESSESAQVESAAAVDDAVMTAS